MLAIWSRPVGQSDKAFLGSQWTENRPGIIRPGGGGLSGNPGGNNRASANQRETQLRGRPGRGVSVVRVDSGGGELSQRLAGDSRRTERLIMRDPELGVTIDHYLGSPGIHRYAAGPGVSFASAAASNMAMHPCRHKY